MLVVNSMLLFLCTQSTVIGGGGEGNRTERVNCVTPLESH